jgi:thioredoxin-like negative regulator of GroEL
MKQVIRYTAKWCGPCKFFAKTFENVASSTPGVQFSTIDVDSGDGLILEHNVRNVPTTVVIENGQVKKQTGAMSEEALRSFIG